MAGKKLWVGIDVGKQFHHACAVDERGKTVFSRKVKNRQGAVEDLITRTAAKAGAIVRSRWRTRRRRRSGGRGRSGARAARASRGASSS